MYCFNTQPPEGGCTITLPMLTCAAFQHTAARRRLDAPDKIGHINVVSTHSRPKAAVTFFINTNKPTGFNTQPPEGGWR